MNRLLSVLVSDIGHFRIIEVPAAALESFQKIVGGYVEAVIDPNRNWHLYCNEDGKNSGLPFNPDSQRFIELVSG